MSDTESIVALFADAATPPPDLTLAALERVILASPGEDTPVLQYIDRCRELNLDALANLVEADLKLKQHRREQKAKKKPPTYLEALQTFFNDVAKTLGIPAHLLDDTKAPEKPSPTPAAPHGTSGTVTVGGQKVPIQAWEMKPVKPLKPVKPVKPPEPLSPNET